MIQPRVSDKAIIREMDAEELEQEWEKTGIAHRQHIKESNGLANPSTYLERYNLIAKQYHQLTGKAIGGPQIEEKICEMSGETMYKCLECGNWEYDVTTEGQCQVCWWIENNPEELNIKID